ncbi:hypothetical protein FGG08_006300 [Glutinoglossum americanum]|uniref:Peptidase A1 domain-containing protein n=1 Tax=Glutinoglossum americanum TaxID=1670608 RepID=A0A9P8L228_9PEZI|nr:hypothetical protein FGG08_006300 [Glutinoglossum americanum]
MEVGTPPQNVRLLPSTSSSSSWVVLPEGCISSDPPDCPSLRGGTFNPNESSTWHSQGLFQLSLYTQSVLGYSGNADIGFENVTIGWQGQGGPALLVPQVVAGIATKDFFIGVLGLNARAVNITDLNHPWSSLLGMLRSDKLVNGSSFGYTAGAPYKPTKVFGSLTFGGYDASRFVPNNVTFTFGADISRDLLVGIRNISTTTSEPVDLLTTPITAFIDSTVPDIWLPVSVCQQFEQTLGLVYEASTELYLVNDTLHDALLARNEVFRFRLGMGVEGGQTVDVMVPYAALDLKVTLPQTHNRTRYFPIRRALNDSMYTIGRAFLQEAYLFTDYDRGTFTISQALFPDTNIPSKLTPVLAPSSTTSPVPRNKGSSPRLTRGAISGIVVSIFLLLIAMMIAFLYFWKRVRYTEAPAIGGKYGTELDAGGDAVTFEATSNSEREMEAGGKDGLRRPLELEGGEVFELSGTEVEVPELGGEGARSAVIDCGKRYRR